MTRPAMSELGASLLEDVPPYMQNSRQVQGVIDVLARETERLDIAIETLRDNFFPSRGGDYLRVWESLLGLAVEPADKTLAQRRNTVLAFLQGLKSQYSGLAWEENLTRLLGTGWTYEEHDVNNPSSPAANTLRITIPFGTVLSPPAAPTRTAVAGYTQTNWVANPKAAANVTSWSAAAYYGGAISTALAVAVGGPQDAANYGRASVRFNVPSGSTMSRGDIYPVPTTAVGTYAPTVAGEAWSASMWVKVEAGLQFISQIRCTASFKTVGGAYLGGGGTTLLTITGDWQQVKVENVVAPATAGVVYLGAEFWGKTNTDANSVATFGVSKVVLSKTTTVPDYFDGDMAGFAWMGTANASRSTTAGALSNYVANPKVATTAKDWSGGAASNATIITPIARVTDAAPPGVTTAVRMTGKYNTPLGGTNSRLTIYPVPQLSGSVGAITAAPGESWSASMWVKIESGLAEVEGVRLDIGFKSAGDVSRGGSSGTTLVPTGGWQLIQVSAVALALTETLYINLAVLGTPTTTGANVVIASSKAMLSKAAIGSEYFDGDTPGFVWLGTANDSRSAVAAATYYYVVTALNGYGQTTAGAQGSIATTGGVSLSWAAVPDATGYRVYRSSVSGGPYRLLATVLPPTGTLNLFKDTSFEETVVSQQAKVNPFNSSIARVTGQSPPHGIYCLEVTATTTPGNQYGSLDGTERVAVTAGVKYNFSGYIKTATAGRVISFMMREYTSGGATIGDVVVGTITGTTTGFTRFEAVYTPSATTAIVAWHTFMASAPLGDKYWLDAVMLSQGDAPAPAYTPVTAASATSYEDTGAVAPGTDQPPVVNSTSSPQAYEAEQLARQITDAHIDLIFGYGQGFIVGVSQVGEEPL